MTMMPTQTYEALLSNPQHVAQVKAAKRAIERIGGALQMLPAQQPGMTLVVLTLPVSYQPSAFFPGLSFYLV
jgi:hypothetical protein